MASARIPVEFDPVITKKVDAAFARLQSKAKGVDFGGGARSIEKLSRPLGKITGQASEFQKSLEASNARVLAFGASVAVINKLSEAFGALVSNTVKVEATFAKINVILGGTQKEIAAFGQGIFDVAKKTGTSFDQVSQGALELARQGLGVSESLSRVETALKLVRVAGIDSEQAVAGLTAAIKGFEGAGLTVAQIGDKLAEVDTKFAVSTEDLINGLERASASARVAGVSFDELLAAVTTVQERTQRGGAVIGNAFKTIFARLGRTDTLQALDNLGISVLDASGNVRDAIPLFKELAVELDRLGLQSVEAGEVIQKVAGVRQRDILINLVEDLNSSQSKFAQSLQVSAGAAGALDKKNQELNKTLEALINNLVVGSQELASTLGDLGFSDAAGDILKTFGQIVEKINNVLQGDTVGAKFAQGLVKGIGSVLTGPGLGLVGAIFLKLFIDLAKFGVTSLKSLLGINSAAAQQKALQDSIFQSLLQNERIQAEILKLEGNKVAQEQLLLKIYNQQAAALARVQKAAATVTPGIYGRGFRGGEQGVARGRGAGGYVAAEARDVSRGVGGAPSSSKVVSIPNFAFGGGKKGTMVANTSEYYVPNYAGGGDAIFNQNMVKAMGLPKGARKIRAAEGYVPNFANKGLSGQAISKRFRERSSDSSFKKEFGSVEFNRQNRAAQTGIASSVRQKRADSLRRQRSSGALVTDPSFAMIVPQALGGLQTIAGTRKKGDTNYRVKFDLVGFGPNVDKRVANDEKLDDMVSQFALDSASKQARLMGLPPAERKDLIRSDIANAGAVSALSGTIFETSVSSLLRSKDFDARSQVGTIDFVGSGANKKLRKLFPDLQSRHLNIEAKNRPSKGNKTSAFDKILKLQGFAAGGYVPSFAGPLMDAVQRERQAGVPINQIRINQSGKLRSAKNPDGLAVTNTRDEPTGRVPNFARGGSVDTKGLNNAIGDSIGKFFLLQAAIGGLTASMGDSNEGIQKFGNALLDGINTLFVLDMVGAKLNKNTFGPMSKIDMTKMRGFQMAVFRMAKPLGKLAGPLAKFGGTLFKISRFAGPVAIGFTAISTAVKAFTGKGILGHLGEKLGILGNKAEAAADKLSKVSDGPITSDAQVTQTRKDLQAQERTIIAEYGGQEQLDQDRARAQELRKQFISQYQEILSIQRREVGNRGQINKKNFDLRSTKEAFGETEKELAPLDEKLLDVNKKLQIIDEKRVNLSSVALDLSENTLAAFEAEKVAVEGILTSRNKIAEKAEKAAAARRVDLQTSYGLSESAKIELDYANRIANERDKAKMADFDRKSSFVDQLAIRKNLSNVDKQSLQTVLERIDAESSFEDIVKAVKDLKLETSVDEQEIYENIVLKGMQEQKNLELAIKILNIKKDEAKTISDSTKGLEGYYNRNLDQLTRMEQEMPARLAENLENSLNNTFDRLTDGSIDSFGDVFLSIAQDFGNALIKEQQRAASKNIMTHLTGSMLGKEGPGAKNSGGFFSGVGEFFGGLFGGKNKKNAGGLINGGSGVKDDVPALLTGGEFVIKKAAVQKYGLEFLSSLNSGGLGMYNQGGQVQGADNLRSGKFWDGKRFGAKRDMVGGSAYQKRLDKARETDFFMPGERGFGSIVGKENLLAFSEQKVTSGATDTIRSSGTSAFIDLETQSARLTAFGQRRSSPAREALMQAQDQAKRIFEEARAEEEDVYKQHQDARTARRKKFQAGVRGAVFNAATVGVSSYLDTRANAQALASVDQGMAPSRASVMAAKGAETAKAGFDFGKAKEFFDFGVEAVDFFGGFGGGSGGTGGASSRGGFSMGSMLSAMVPSSTSPGGVKVFGSGEQRNPFQLSFSDLVGKVDKISESLKDEGIDVDRGFSSLGKIISERMNQDSSRMSITSTMSKPDTYQGTFDRTNSITSKRSRKDVISDLEDMGLLPQYFAGGQAGSHKAMLQGGEYVIGAGAAAQIGRQTLEDINGMRYAAGGAVGGSVSSSSPNSKADVENVNISINVEKDGNTITESDTDQSSRRAQELSKRIKDVVLQVINEEKRVSGSLFTRNK